MPKRTAVMHYFTYHAELLPHTEQVIFTKVNWFGHPRYSTVDIKNLEKIDASEITQPLLWDMAPFDSELVFRDSKSLEIFVFDKDGIWN